MSEHDYWQVESSVYGGVGYAPATLEEYAAIAKALDDEAAGFAAIATAWESAALQLQSHRHSAPMCVTLQSGDPSAVVPGHVTAPYAALGNRCYDHATACQRLSDDLRGAADLLIRAHSLYSHEAYLGADWVGPPRGQIDQYKEIRAAEKRIEIGITTLAEETAALTGGDWERKHPQTAKEHMMRKSLK